MKNIQIISDSNSKSLKIKKSLLKIIKNVTFKKLKISIVIGGDGFMPVSYTHLKLPTI